MIRNLTVLIILTTVSSFTHISPMDKKDTSYELAVENLSLLYDAIHTSPNWLELTKFAYQTNNTESIDHELNIWAEKNEGVKTFYSKYAELFIPQASPNEIIELAQNQVIHEKNTLTLDHYQGQFTHLPMIKLYAFFHFENCVVTNNNNLMYLQGADIVAPKVTFENCKDLQISPKFFEYVRPVFNSKKETVLPHITVKGCPEITGSVKKDPTDDRNVLIDSNPIALLEAKHPYFAVAIEEEQPDWNDELEEINGKYRYKCTDAIHTTYAIYRKPFGFRYFRQLYLLWEYVKRIFLPNIYSPCTQICTFKIIAERITYKNAMTETWTDDNGKKHTWILE